MLMRCKMGKTCFGGKGNGLGCSMFGMLNVWDAWDAQCLGCLGCSIPNGLGCSIRKCLIRKAGFKVLN